MAEAIQISERAGLGLATVMARKGVAAAALGERLGLGLADGPRMSQSGQLALVGTGPGVWLAVEEESRGGWAKRLGQSLGGVASVSDQSSAYRVLRFSGTDAQALLQKGLYLDLDPQAFPVRAAAASQIAHIGVIVWRLDAANFDLALFRSYASSFAHWVAAAGGPDFQFS